MINHYENAPVSVPFHSMQVLAKALNISISDLFSSEQSTNPLDNLDVRWIKKMNAIK
ncbi:MAG: hypothetical protein ACLFR1_13470 [Spirochaetia bacterium]